MHERLVLKYVPSQQCVFWWQLVSFLRHSELITESAFTELKNYEGERDWVGARRHALLVMELCE